MPEGEAGIPLPSLLGAGLVEAFCVLAPSLPRRSAKLLPPRKDSRLEEHFLAITASVLQPLVASLCYWIATISCKIISFLKCDFWAPHFNGSRGKVCSKTRSLRIMEWTQPFGSM